MNWPRGSANTRVAFDQQQFGVGAIFYHRRPALLLGLRRMPRTALLVAAGRALSRIELLVDRTVVPERHEDRPSVPLLAETDRPRAPKIARLRLPRGDADRAQDAG